MKIGFPLRKISIKINNFIRNLRAFYYYFLDCFYENSFKKGQIKTLLTIQEGAIGDTYNFIGILNEFSMKYPYIKIYCLTRPKTKNLYKNPKLHVISPSKAENLIKDKQIDALISYGRIDNFFKKRLIFNIPYRAGRKFSFKVRTVPDDILLIFKKLGFELKNLKFYFTKEGEEIAKKFYKENNLKSPIIFLHVGSGRTVRALKEGKIPSALWASENWAKVADYLMGEYNCTIVFTGIKEEEKLVEDVISKMKNKENVLNITGKFSIEGVASIVKKGDLVIGVDCGLIHVLSQINIPLVILFAGDPKISAPYKEFVNLWCGKGVCSGCMKYYCIENNAVCINSIKVKDVLNKLPILS